MKLTEVADTGHAQIVAAALVFLLSSLLRKQLTWVFSLLTLNTIKNPQELKAHNFKYSKTKPTEIHLTL